MSESVLTKFEVNQMSNEEDACDKRSNEANCLVHAASGLPTGG